MRDKVTAYVGHVKELAEHVRGNEQATKKSLIEPLFTALGYDIADPRECMPEYRADFGRARSAKPVDYAFSQNAVRIFVVEAKEVGRKLAGFDEQLADYFAKCQTRLGILSNGIHWRFFTDLESEHLMDKKPFVEWFVLSDESPPWDFLTLLQKSRFDAELIRTYAQRQRQQNLLVEELGRLLEPAPEFVRLAIANIETRYLTASVVEGWKPVLKAAIVEWAKQQRLSTVLSGPPAEAPAEDESRGTRPIETTQAELDGFAAVQRLLGPSRPVEYQDMPGYFKIHLAGKPFWAVCRLVDFGERRQSVRVRLPAETVQSLAPTLNVTPRGQRWCRVRLAQTSELELLQSALCKAWDELAATYGTEPDNERAEDE